ncbi:MAG TPA: sulfite reductase subunit alpha [Fibrobacteria bacterium]|nr:sulfite reductase subunit alpha [Fibrobacteria bacterium]
MNTETPANVIPEGAPFSTEQRQWLNGYIAGLHSLSLLGSASSGPSTGSGTGRKEEPQGTPVLILYGSQSGNAEGLAHDFAARIRARAGGAALKPRVLGMDAYGDVDFSAEKYVLAVNSTWGDGDMPDNAVAFWNWLQGAEAPSLGHAAVAVLGLGDRNYRRFCQGGKNLDGRFAELGARRLRPLCECDTDYESAAATWLAAVLEEIDKELPAAVTTGGEDPNRSADIRKGDPWVALAEGQSRYDKKNPFPAALLENRPLNARGSAKDTRHLAFSLVGSGLEYKAGDALGILPRNDYDLADRLILRLNCGGNERVALPWGEESTLRAALVARLDLRRGSVKLLEALLRGARNPSERARLEELLSAPESDETRAWLDERDALDVLDAFAKSNPDPQDVIGAMARLTPRLYSIASSPKAHPGEVHLCVGIVRAQVGGRLRRGVASTYLAERVPLGTNVPVFVQPSAHFGVPENGDAPLIMIGPGTGIAPFRAFLEERQARGDKGRNWLFFGDQKRSRDFLYGEDLEALHGSGFLTRLDLAFSRDQAEKVYVQDRMLENARRLYAWLEEGAHFCVCGDAKRMAKDVDAALHRIVAQEGAMSEDKAREYVEGLKKAGRYARDVY